MKAFITHMEYNTESLRSNFRYEGEYFRPRCVAERARRHPISISHLPKKDQNDVGFKIDCIKEFYKIYYAKRISRTGDRYKRAAELISIELGLLRKKYNRDVHDPTTQPKKRGCRNNVDAVLNGSVLQRWVERLEQADWDYTALRDGRYRSGNHDSRFSGETRDLLHSYSIEYRKPHCPTRDIVYQDFAVAFEALNDRFRDEGRPLDNRPSFSRFCLEIAKLDGWDVDFARLGHQAAHRKHKLIGPGQDVYYALERMKWTIMRSIYALFQ